MPELAVINPLGEAVLLYDGEEHVSILQYDSVRDRAIMLDGWSKTYAMTGWRLGFAVWPKSLVSEVTRLCINDHSCVNASAQYAGLAALTGPQDAVAEMMVAFNQRRTLIVDALNSLPGVRCADAAGAFYAFPNISGTGLTSRQAQDLFLNEANVATVSGTSFGAWGEGFVRFSYANSAENIERAMDRIRKVL